MESASKEQSDGGRKVKPASRLVRLVFSLRTLMLFVAMLGIALAYHVNWVSQRRAFLSDQVARLESHLSHEDENARAQLINWWNAQQPPVWRDPGPIRLLRDQPPVYGMFVLVPTHDIVVKANKYEVRSGQVDLKRARQLFPEEDVRPMYWKDHTAEGEDEGFQEVQVVD